MESYIQKKRCIIKMVSITGAEINKRFEIKLPANVKRITGVIITSSRTS